MHTKFQDKIQMRFYFNFDDVNQSSVKIMSFACVESISLGVMKLEQNKELSVRLLKII